MTVVLVLVAGYATADAAATAAAAPELFRSPSLVYYSPALLHWMVGLATHTYIHPQLKRRRHCRPRVSLRLSDKSVYVATLLTTGTRT